MTPQLQAQVDRMTCRYCAGTGSVTTQINKTFAGNVFREECHVRDCPVCEGSGINLGSVKQA